MATAALMTVHGGDRPPSLAEAAAELGVASQDIDAGFGVVPIDLSRGLYAVQLRDGASARPDERGQYRGPFSNPAIAPFGPVR